MDILSPLGIKEVNAGVSTATAQWLFPKNVQQIASFNPSKAEIIAYVSVGDEDNYHTVVENANQAFLTWRNLPAPKRGEIVRQIANKLREKKDLLGSLVALEMGKSKQEGDGEVQEMIDIADFAVGQARMLYGQTMHSERPEHRMYEQWHPLGAIAVFSAFNFPVAVWAWNAFIAAIAGNTVIWKPSPKVPLCAIAVQNICNEVMTQNNLSSIFSLFITDDNQLAEKFLDDTRLPLISFTGSTAVGRIIAQKVAARFGRTILELSGNNAVIVDETANLKLAIPAIVFGAIGTAGQRCTSTRRLIIQENVFPEMVEGLLHAYRQVTIGDPLDKKNIMGPLIDEKAVANYKATIEEIKKAGGQILFGGDVLERAGNFVTPCIAQVESHWPMVQRETFAPILYVMSYKNLAQAIMMQNEVKQGLSSALFTNNLPNAETFLSASGSDCGIANINIGTSGAEIGGAFGGEKETGGGREAGSDAWKNYMRRQTNTINWGSTLPLAQGIKFNL